MDKLITVNFHEDDIICIKDKEGNVWVSVKRLCENIGLTRQGQVKRIKEDPKFRWNDIVLRDVRGRKQKHFCITVDQIQGWLNDVNANKVNPEIRDKLIHYQQECMQVLNDYWIKGQVINPRSQPVVTQKSPTNMIELLASIESMLKQKIDEAVSKALDYQESIMRTQHSQRVVEVFKPIMVSGDQRYREWAFTQMKKVVEDELNPYTYFRLWTLFQHINPSLTKEQCKKLANEFRKLDEVKAYSRGHVMESYDDKAYMVIRYERRDWDELRDLAIEWMRDRTYGSKQNTLFSQQD